MMYLKTEKYKNKKANLIPIFTNTKVVLYQAETEYSSFKIFSKKAKIEFVILSESVKPSHPVKINTNKFMMIGMLKNQANWWRLINGTAFFKAKRNDLI